MADNGRSPGQDALKEGQRDIDNESTDGRRALQRMLDDVRPAMVSYFSSQSFEDTVMRVLEKKSDRAGAHTSRDTNAQTIQLHKPCSDDSHRRTKSVGRRRSRDRSRDRSNRSRSKWLSGGHESGRDSRDADRSASSASRSSTTPPKPRESRRVQKKKPVTWLAPSICRTGNITWQYQDSTNMHRYATLHKVLMRVHSFRSKYINPETDEEIIGDYNDIIRGLQREMNLISFINNHPLGWQIVKEMQHETLCDNDDLIKSAARAEA